MKFGEIRDNLRYLQTRGYKTSHARKDAFQRMVIEGNMDEDFFGDSLNSIDDLAHLDFTKSNEMPNIKPRFIGSAERTISSILYAEGSVSRKLNKSNNYL